MQIRRLMLAVLLLLPLHAHAEASAPSDEWRYIVANGDSLWNISARYLTDVQHYQALQQLNQIKRPNNLQPGSLVRVPMAWIAIQPATAQISAMTGRSDYQRAGTWQPLTDDVQLQLGDKLHLGKDASVTIRFADGSEVTAFNQAIIYFDHLSAYGKTGMVDTRIRLEQGKVETRAQKASGPGSRLDISTPSAISAVRGTVYRVSSDAESQTARVEVLEGLVAVSAENKAESIPKGFGTQVQRGQPPSPPVSLLPAPALIDPPKTVQAQRQMLNWQPQDKARNYRIQVSDRADFSRILWQQLNQDNQMPIPELDDGHYFVRVTALDSSSIEGFPVSHAFELDRQPLAPTPLTRGDLFNQGQEARLQWQPAHQNSSALVQIAKDRLFTELISEKQLEQQDYWLSTDLPYGSYYWRVATIKDGEQGPYSEPESLNWQPVLVTPQCHIAPAANQTAELHCSPFPPQRLLHIQVADDAGFSQGVWDILQAGQTRELQVAPDSPLYIRVRFQSADKQHSGSWASTLTATSLPSERGFFWGILAAFGILL